MKKYAKIIFVIVGLIGVTAIPTTQAIQPYKHVTFGEVTAAFNTAVSASQVLISHESYEAAPVAGKAGRIDWFFGGEYCVNDAHFIQIVGWFNYEDHELAKELYDGEAKYGTAETKMYINGIKQETILTPLHRSLYVFPPDPKYGWWFGVGQTYGPGELAIGDYELMFSMEGINPFTGEWDIFFQWVSYFSIVECWH